MGRQTPDKSYFDDEVVRFFTHGGYQATTMGGSLADVVAWHDERSEFAIIEVKSPAETTVDSSYSYGTGHLAERNRKETWQWLEREGFRTSRPGIAKLIAFTISSQLFHYWQEREKHVERFKREINLSVSDCAVSTYLALPADYQPVLVTLLAHFRKVGVRSSPVTAWGPICLVKIEYPA